MPCKCFGFQIVLHFSADSALLLCCSGACERICIVDKSATMAGHLCFVYDMTTWPDSWCAPSRSRNLCGQWSCPRQASQSHLPGPRHTALQMWAKSCDAHPCDAHPCHRPQWHCSKSCRPCSVHLSQSPLQHCKEIFKQNQEKDYAKTGIQSWALGLQGEIAYMR